ncbi:Tpr-related protein family member, putative [Theileria annulata]|uniref:Tpr-related protein family member, putative n=1 Tax=Theileria annulata TaxID=5874 RepID=Q4UIL8_THEAN|nr:Tpr-related protein family member, putative [Theileria annulata]CAI73071.1 Tpr-related protein family member, putative [Theileria annulata]|eukprot:XP_953749.1 Tpr-related protein family member, putative [Theileria annulata]
MAGDDPIKIVNYTFAGLAMMLNIRLVYSASPYALMRFKLPENLFSVFVRVMASALELWCLPSMVIGNIIDIFDKYISDPHERRRFSDAHKYDVKDSSLGDGLKDKAEELQAAAKVLQTKAESVGGLSGLTTPAGQLSNGAGLLATNPGQASEIINNFNQLETQYNGLVGEKAKVKSEFEAVEHIYNRMLNVTKAGKLQNQVGDQVGSSPGEQKIWHHANLLYAKANALANASGLNPAQGDDAQKQKLKAELRELATALANAVGADHQAQGSLQKALSDLSSANDSNIVEKAITVINKYKDVTEKYNAVTDKEGKYRSVLVSSADEFTTKYTPVKSQFGQLKEKFDAAKCRAITPIFDKEWIRYISIFWSWSNFVTFVILFFVFIPGDEGHVTVFYWVIAASGFVFGINMVMVYAMEYEYFPWYIAGENSFPIITSFMHYVSTLMFGNRRKWNSDYIVVLVDMVISLAISLIAASLWTYCYVKPSTHEYFGPSDINPAIVSPVLMVLVGMGLVYTIYPAIAPGMIVPFYLIDKIEMVLLILTTFPPLIFATLRKLYGFQDPAQPMCGWSNPTVFWKTDADGRFWHAFDILMPLQISLAFIFIYSLHYRDSHISRSIINQPKMSTALSIIFYMCHEIMLALGFPGMIGNNGGDQIMLPIQLIGAFLMVLLAFYSIGYITEYKRHDPSQWPTEGMTKWNAMCYWLKMASKITNKNFKQLFTNDLWKYLDIFYFN